MKNKLTEKDIQNVLDNSEISFKTVDKKCTLCKCKLPNGFVLFAHTGAISTANYDFEIGKASCLEDIKEQLWKLEGYHLASKIIEKPKYIDIKWQSGTVNENGVNGVQVSDVLKIAKDRLIELNDEHSCKENRLTIVSIDNALNYQDMRDHDRVARKVEGTYHD
ncbi:Gp49 family protein [Apilactobacillus sp. TMW 2.2459]|uniref:Gp49 family protein n=1 Tax=Apilactobacillus xinyiensis TaxID=2841032 RepID=UPI00200D06C4|nr:Gp49 family protein [Apilactobacillus xinyiensis]MCL0312808.1 Gp49 family protein [Apilactobacillus xinyiensis]